MAAGRIRKRMTRAGVRWQAIVDIDPDPVTGKRRSRSSMERTERAAKAALAKMQVQADRGALGPRHVHTVADLCTTWLDTSARFKSALTYDSYARSVRLYITPYLGTAKAQDLRPDRVRAWVASLLEAGRGQRTVHLALHALHQALAQATRDGILLADVTAGIRVPAPTDRGRAMHTWTEQDAARFLAVAERSPLRYGPIFHLSLATGMRSGELRGLRWCDVDWAESTLHLRQAVGPDPAQHHLVFKPLKSKGSRRDVLVDESVMEALRAHRTRQAAWRLRLGPAWRDHDLVFCTQIGTPIDASPLGRLYRRIREEAGVPPIRLHDHRHTHITWALEEGADLKAVSERAGHSDVAVTARVYQHVTRKQQADIVAKIAAKMQHG